MLVLSRKKNEQIVIQLGDQKVVIKVVDMARDRVRLGVTAPAEVPVHRQEVADRIGEWQENHDTAAADTTT